MMKKTNFVNKLLALLMVMLCSVIGCSAMAEDDLVQAEIPVQPVFPAQYLIAYDVMENDTIFTVARGQDAEGRIYSKVDDQEQLFVPMKNGYALYEKQSDGMFCQIGTRQYTLDYIQKASARFEKLAGQAKQRLNGVSAFTEETQFLDRTCSVYAFDVTILNFSTKYTMTVDQETGVCMSWIKETRIGSHDLTDNEDFECVQFETDAVTLPVSIEQ